jgi:pyruvate dehydrogenase E1 component
VSDRELAKMPFKRFGDKSPEQEYLVERRRALGGSVPQRVVRGQPLTAPAPSLFEEFLKGSEGRPAATTMALVRMLGRLLRDKELGKLIVPIVPDEARTFGMEALFATYGIYAHGGQRYEPVDAHMLMKYEERQNGQIIEEGITEAGAMASFIAAGTAYATFDLNTIPFFIFYSMFGFQRIGDLIWAAGDMRVRGFLVGGTAGRTTLQGEGLQHCDGNSQLTASLYPNCISYDCAYAYELATVVREGIRRMYEEGESVFYYLTVYNETYEMPPLPPGVETGILRGLYKVSPAEEPEKLPRVHLFGSGPLLREALRAQTLLREKFGVGADVWSVTSYNELYRNALACTRWNRLHPGGEQRTPYITRALGSEAWPIVATSDYAKAIPHRLCPWTPKGLAALGTDGFGRSDTRHDLRRFFEVDAEHMAYTALTELARLGQFDEGALLPALRELGIDPDAPEPAES